MCNLSEVNGAASVECPFHILEVDVDIIALLSYRHFFLKRTIRIYRILKDETNEPSWLLPASLHQCRLHSEG